MKGSHGSDRGGRDSFRALTDEELRRVTGGEDEQDAESSTRKTCNRMCRVCGIPTAHHRDTDGRYVCDICGTVTE